MRQDLFQQLQEKELQATLKCILSVSERGIPPLTTSKIRNMNKSQHWYDKDGNACFEVPKAKGGGMRATTLADARKLGLYPSVTTIMGVMAKPQLDDWKLQQVAERAYANPPQDGEEAGTYARRTIDGAFEQVGDAADLGSHQCLSAGGLLTPDLRRLRLGGREGVTNAFRLGGS